jgi:RNA-directed DNA polymerase
MRHLPVKEQVINLNRVMRGHYAYYGIAGNMRALQKLHRHVERYWREMLNSRNREGRVTWETFQKIKTLYPLQRPKLVLPYPKLQAIAVL